jgi:hypothetical protein
MDEPPTEGGDRGLGAVLNIQPHENRAHVTFHRGFRDAQLTGNLPIALAVDQQVQTRDLRLDKGCLVGRRLEAVSRGLSPWTAGAKREAPSGAVAQRDALGLATFDRVRFRV